MRTHCNTMSKTTGEQYKKKDPESGKLTECSTVSRETAQARFLTLILMGMASSFSMGAHDITVLSGILLSLGGS